MNILFTICARAGSKGFKNKNLTQMNGIPLLFYTLAVIKLFKDSHDDEVSIAVNTDSEELAAIAQRQKLVENLVFVERKAELAGDRVAKVVVIKDTYLQTGRQFDAVIDLDLTSPIRRFKDVEQIINVYQNNQAYDLVFSVVPSRRSPYFNMVEKKPDGFYQKICASNYVTRQQAPASYELNASIYLFSPRFLQSEITKPILDYSCGIVVMPDYLVLDIDSEQDFVLMEYLHQYYCSQDRELNLVYQTAKTAITAFV
jgi:CMP-N,N'-diacetyllegionaminic acid synthase